MDSNEFDSYSIYIVSIQSTIIKSLIEAVKEILPDTNIEINEDSIRILSIDPTHTSLVHLNLNAANFEKFHCTHPQILGVNMINLFKLIKTVSSNNMITLFVQKNDQNHLGIKIENTVKNTSTTFKLNLMDLSSGNIKIPPATFSSIITMKSSEFQKTCRDMLNISDDIEIKSVDKNLILTCSGDFAEQVTVIGESSSNGIHFNKLSNAEEEIIQGVFSLKYLTMFSKCTSLSPNIQIYLKNNYPLILSYCVGSLGEVRMCLAPKQT